MLFREWLLEQEQTTICIDLDNTLIHHTDEGTCVRPGVEEFLDEIQKLGPCCIFTYGMTAKQKRIAESVGITLPLFGRDEFHKMEPNGNYILIDNRHPDYPHTTCKMDALGIGPDRFISVRTWLCGDGPDDDLERALEVARTALSEWVEKKGKDRDQPFHTYGAAKKLATSLEEEFEEKLHAAADGNKVVVDIKSKASFEDKTEDRDKEPEKVFDVLRATILVYDKDDIFDIIDNLGQHFEVKKIEHNTKPDEYGYYGPSNVDVVLRGMVCEVQIMTHKLWKAKYETTVKGTDDCPHDLYKKHRSGKVPQELAQKTKAIYKKANEGA